MGKKKGWVYFGAFPVQRLKRVNGYARVKGVGRKWVVNVDSIELRSGMGDGTTSLHNMSTRFGISLSHKTLQMPKAAIKSIENILRGSKI